MQQIITSRSNYEIVKMISEYYSEDVKEQNLVQQGLALPDFVASFFETVIKFPKVLEGVLKENDFSYRTVLLNYLTDRFADVI